MNHKSPISILLIVGAFSLTGCGLFATSMYRTVEYRPVHEAVLKGDVEKLDEITKADPSQVNAPDYDKDTPLHLAVLRGDAHAVTFLLKKGADVNAKNHVQMTPLILAARGGQTAIVRELLSRKPDLNAKDARGFTALAWALRTKHEEIAKVLRGAGAGS